jgi:hypothetical protein
LEPGMGVIRDENVIEKADIKKTAYLPAGDL